MTTKAFQENLDEISKQIEWLHAVKKDLAAGKITLTEIKNHSFWSLTGGTEKETIVTLDNAVKSKNKHLIEFILDEDGSFTYGWGMAIYALRKWFERVGNKTAGDLFKIILDDNTSPLSMWRVRTGRDALKNADYRRIKKSALTFKRLTNELESQTIQPDQDILKGLRSSLDGLEMAKFVELIKAATVTGKITPELAESFTAWANS